MNNSEQLTEDRVYLTVAEYAQRFGVSENTVRTRINRSKLQTVRVERDGREVICIPVRVEQLQADLSPEWRAERSDAMQGVIQNSSSETGERSGELLEFMHETFLTVQGYANQLIELSRENERYKLLSDGKTKQVGDLERQIEQLKEQLFEKEAKVKELSVKAETPQKPWWRLWT